MSVFDPISVLLGLLVGSLFMLWLWFRSRTSSSDAWEEEADKWRDKYVATLEGSLDLYERERKQQEAA